MAREQLRSLRPDEDQRWVHPVVVGLAVPLDKLSDDDLEELVKGIKLFPTWIQVHEYEDREYYEDQGAGPL